MDETFFLPDRFEGLKETAGDKDITKIIIPVEYGLNKIQDIYEEIYSSGRVLF